MVQSNWESTTDAVRNDEGRSLEKTDHERRHIPDDLDGNGGQEAQNAKAQMRAYQSPAKATKSKSKAGLK